MSDLKLEGAARTLALTLRARADEHARIDALFRDPQAVTWLAHLPQYADYDAWYNPVFQLASAIRTHLIDTMTERFLQSHSAACVVELGAGLSTRFYRLGIDAGVDVGTDVAHWVEVDLPNAITVRQALEGETERHRYIVASLAETAWLDQLPDVAHENRLFIMEGVAMFLPPDAMTGLFAALRDRFPGATFVFDVVHEKTRSSMNKAFCKLEAPMLWGVEPDEIAGFGLDVREIRYLLLEQPECWAALEVNPDNLTRERSGFVVDAVLQAL